MHNLQAMPDSNFVVKGFNIAGLTQPTDANRANFSSETTLDAALAALVPAKDRPYLTMNDKVYAVRQAVTVFAPVTAEVESPPEVIPEEEDTE